MTKIAWAENIRARLWDRGNEVECEVWGTKYSTFTLTNSGLYWWWRQHKNDLHLPIYFRTVISDIGGIMQMVLSRSLKILKCGMIVATGAGQSRPWTLASWHSPAPEIWHFGEYLAISRYPAACGLWTIADALPGSLVTTLSPPPYLAATDDFFCFSPAPERQPEPHHHLPQPKYPSTFPPTAAHHETWSYCTGSNMIISAKD